MNRYPTSATINIDAPQRLGNGELVDIAFVVDVECIAICNESDEAVNVEITGTEAGAALTVAGIDVALVGLDQGRLFQSWLAYDDGNRQRLVEKCAAYWKRCGRERYFDDREIEALKR